MSESVSWTESKCAQYEFSLEIAASTERVWRAVTDQLGAWWLPNYHMLGENSTIELEAKAGGRLVERTDTGELLWYTVIAIDQGKSLELAGYCSAKYGGPASTLLCLDISHVSDRLTRLRVSDSLYGRVSDGFVRSLQSGWQELFGKGLVPFVTAPPEAA